MSPFACFTCGFSCRYINAGRDTTQHGSSHSNTGNQQHADCQWKVRKKRSVFVQMQINVTVPQKNEYCQPQECKSLHLKVFVL